jgi:hypothetical protein
MGKVRRVQAIEAAKKTGEDVTRMRQEVRRQLLMTRLVDKLTENVTVGADEVAIYYGSTARHSVYQRWFASAFS